MTIHPDDDDMAALENEPVFICSQMLAGHVLTDEDVSAIQSMLLELDDRENSAVDEFSRGREFGIREIGGDELFAAVTAKHDAYITKIVREAMAKMGAKTAEIKAATLPGPDDEEVAS